MAAFLYKAGDMVLVARKQPNWRHWHDGHALAVAYRNVVRIESSHVDAGGNNYYMVTGSPHISYILESVVDLVQNYVAPPPPPPVKRPAIEQQLADALHDHHTYIKGQGSNITSVSSYRVFYKEGDMVSVKRNDATYCHAAMNSLPNGILAIVENLAYYRTAFKARLGNEDEEEDGVGVNNNLDAQCATYLRYVDYILNRSPVKDVFLTKDVEDAITNGCHINCELGQNQIVVGQVMLRMGREGYCDLKTFQKVLDLGHSEHVAWLMGTMYRHGVDGKPSLQYPDRHCMISGGHLVSTLTKFFSDEFKWPKQQAITKGHSRYRLFDTVGEEAYMGRDSITEQLKAATQGAGKRAFGQPAAEVKDLLITAANFLTEQFKIKEEENA